MKNQVLKKIRKISFSVRKKMERYQKRNKKNFVTDDLCGLCAIASGELFKKLKENKINTTICFSDYHCFLMYEEYVIDITATQYGLNKVLICQHKKLKKDYDEYEIIKKFKSLKGARKFQITTDWPSYQIIS